MATFSDKPTLIGDRVRLRPVTGDDAAAMFADLADDETTRLTGTHQTFTLEQIQTWCGSRQNQDDRLDLAVVAIGSDGEPGRWAGEIVVNEWDPDNRSCSLRIALSAGFRGYGIGTEAISLLLDYLFTVIGEPPVNRVELEVFDFNSRAMALYRKLRFHEEGRRRQALCWDGQFHDAIIMSMLRSEWRP